MVKRRQRISANHPMTWEQFKGIFFKKYFPQNVKDQKEEEFWKLVHNDMTIAQNEAKFTSLSRHAPHLVDTENCKARRFEKGLKHDMKNSPVFGQGRVRPEIDGGDKVAAAARNETDKSQGSMGHSNGGGGGGLHRYVSAPSSMLTTAVDSVIGGLNTEFTPLLGPAKYFSSEASSLTSESTCKTNSKPEGGLQRSYGFDEIGVGHESKGGGCSSSTSCLVRHSSSPAGFLNRLASAAAADNSTYANDRRGEERRGEVHSPDREHDLKEKE
ncbi:hypothetical protein RJ639_032001 [Escallonia herrerae]|uniref:Retrotransposon gag domain-containing protein n=1 Tax=Escallonia herrerae TaxID=1293975 RepID=A0AA88X616_9ASTE|nr:hypothetical protein RJ639_032001 [Escallonia herrerae]